MRTNRSNTGKAFEKTIETVLIQYAAKGKMRLKKVDAPMRFAGGHVILLQSPWLDFAGCWTGRGGRAVFLEAKSTSKDTLPLDQDGGVTVNQVEALRNWHNAGAVAFVLWEFKGSVRLLTWPQIRDILVMRKHAKLTDGQPVPAGLGFVIHDFLKVMETTWPCQ